MWSATVVSASGWSRLTRGRMSKMTKIERNIIAVLDNGPKSLSSLLRILDAEHDSIDVKAAVLSMVICNVIVLKDRKLRLP